MDLVHDSLPHGWRLILQNLMNATIGFVLCALLTVVGVSVVIEQYDPGRPAGDGDASAKLVDHRGPAVGMGP